MQAEKTAADYWDSYVTWYEAYLDNSPHKELVWQRLAPLLAEKNSFLDIGAGTGVFSLAAAAIVPQVCCVEFSAQMRQRIYAKAAGQGKKVECLADDWEEISLDKLGKYDVVLAAHSFYQMQDLPAALGKMFQAAAEKLMIVTNANYAPGKYHQLREQLAEYQIKTNLPKKTPHHEEIIAYLKNAGASPSVEILEYSDGHYYNNLDEAVSHVLFRLGIDESERNIVGNVLGKYLTKIYGRLCLLERTKTAVIVCGKE